MLFCPYATPCWHANIARMSILHYERVVQRPSEKSNTTKKGFEPDSGFFPESSRTRSMFALGLDRQLLASVMSSSFTGSFEKDLSCPLTHHLGCNHGRCFTDSLPSHEHLHAITRMWATKLPIVALIEFRVECFFSPSEVGPHLKNTNVATDITTKVIFPECSPVTNRSKITKLVPQNFSSVIYGPGLGFTPRGFCDKTPFKKGS